MVEIASDRPLFKTILVEMGKVWSVLEGQYSSYKQVWKKSAGLQMFFTEPTAFEPCASRFETLP
jgi:hypothetical protein